VKSNTTRGIRLTCPGKNARFLPGQVEEAQARELAAAAAANELQLQLSSLQMELSRFVRAVQPHEGNN